MFLLAVMSTHISLYDTRIRGGAQGLHATRLALYTVLGISGLE